MGFTNKGMEAAAQKTVVRKKAASERVVALAGNPNVGKSTVFNALTGMRQHTGNWPGKTVALAQGRAGSGDSECTLVDLPGAYSLMARSPEEEVSRSFICFGEPDAVVLVCDACCLERNLNLVLQTIESGQRVLLCVNLLDEAKKKHIHIDIAALADKLGVPAIGISARDKGGADALARALDELWRGADRKPFAAEYPECIEQAAELVEGALTELPLRRLSSRWLSLRLLEEDRALEREVEEYLGYSLRNEPQLIQALGEAKALLEAEGVDEERYKDMVVSALINSAEALCRETVTRGDEDCQRRDRRIDKLLTGRFSAYPIMLCLLALVFWLTIVGANYPSALLAKGLFQIQDWLSQLFIRLNAPEWLHGCLVLGVYRVLAWVVSVMLPPMAIFFPLFTLLEDIGYLPRIAYNLDGPFKRCSACGKQALTMCMGFGCNAAGVVGCRIIDSPRERMLAILTNNFVPCNGRFPTLIAILGMFFAGVHAGALGSVVSALLLTAVIVLGICVTLAVTRLLSKTLLKGLPSSFTLELPPYRRPQIGRVILRSIFDRSIFVLGRAAMVAAPAGLIIWLAANLTVGGDSVLGHCSAFLDPFARLMGLDGVILIAFILGFPANEIVLPIIIMAYTAQGSLTELESLAEMRQLFVEHGWTWITALSTMLFSLMHWPCSTTLLTIRKETGSWKWAGLAAAIPTAAGICACVIFNAAARLLS